MDDCVFCNIINKTTKSEILMEDDQVIVIRDILPKAPIHVLVIPKAHLPGINRMERFDEALVGHMVGVAREIAVKLGVGDSGYKLVFNVGRDGGQVVEHLHLHVLGGKKLPE